MKFTIKEIGRVVGAENDLTAWEDLIVNSFEFDSRKVQAGSLFVPLTGERDGHDFLEKAIEQGAVATFWQRTFAPADNFPYLQVADPLVAFQQLAHYAIKRQKVKVVGITGSNGKTTTKDFTAAVLASHYHVYKTQGNYNNHIGLPYTVLHMPEATEILVLELGMDHFGEITVLSKIAEPAIAAITMIGESHLEHLGSRGGIAQAKMEITAGMSREGLLLLPNDEPLLAAYQAKSLQRCQTFGFGDADFSAYDVQSGKAEAHFKVQKYPELIFTIPVPGQYNVKNALIALMIGDALGLSAAAMQQSLATATLTQNRTEWLKAKNGAEVLSDVYNANPTAMRLMLENFSSMPKKITGERKVVLGDMLELGPQSAEFHQQIAEVLKPATIQTVFLFGREMGALYEVLQMKYPAEHLFYFEKTQKSALIAALLENLQPTDMVALKGSNGMGLNEVVAKLIGIS